MKSPVEMSHENFDSPSQMINLAMLLAMKMNCGSGPSSAPQFADAGRASFMQCTHHAWCVSFTREIHGAPQCQKSPYYGPNMANSNILSQYIQWKLS